MNKIKRMKKLILITMVFFLAFTVKAQNENKTYETDDFSIQYPITWDLQTDMEAPAIFAVRAPATSDEDIFAENVNLITQNLKGYNMNLDQYIELNEGQIKTISNSQLFSSKRKKSDGGEYHVLEFKGSMSGMDLKVIQLYAIKNEIAYILTFTTMENEFEELRKIGTKILESFKLK